MIKPSLSGTLVIILLITLWSCSPSEPAPFKNEVTLDINSHLIIPIDSVTKRTSKITHFNQAVGELCLFNEMVHKLYFFDVNSGATVRIVDIKSEGPNSIEQVDKLIFHTYDSIFLYNSATRRLNIIDTTGQVKSRHQFVDPNKGDPTPISRPAIMHFDGHNFFMAVRTNTSTREDKDKVLMKYNLRTGKREFLMNLPKSYKEGRWADKIVERALAFNPSTKELAVSFPFDAKLNVIDLDTKKESQFERSSSLLHKPEYGKGLSDIQSRIVYLMSNSWYGQLYFDPINEIYLRSAEVGKNIEYGDPINAKYLSKNNDEIYSVTIILDKNFRKIAEVPALSFGETIFSSEGFIYIPDRTYQSDNEDIMAFAQYEIKNIEK